MGRIAILKHFIFLFCFCLIFTSKASATTYYVSPNGNDTNPGTSALSPWKTISKINGRVSAGDTINVLAGIYQQEINLTVSGNSGNPIRIIASPDAVIDGNNYTLATNWGALLNLSGNYIQVAGFEVRYSEGIGVILTGQSNIVSNLNSHHNKENGILITGNNNVVENSTVWSNCMTNVNGNSSTGWASGLSAARKPNNAIIRGNTVYGNWGEGVSSYEATNTTIEGNIIYDNWSANIYLSDTTGAIAQRNFLYRTGSLANTGGIERGIALGDEICNPESSNNKVLNNIVWGFNRNVEYWGTASCSTHGLLNVVIANNTLIDAIGNDGNLFISSAGGHSNTTIMNNIVFQSDSKSICRIESKTGLTLGNNLWSKTCSSGSGSNDITGDPMFIKTGSITNPNWFKLSSNSPAINKASVLPAITEDYFKNVRGTLPDIGAHEYNESTAFPTNTPSGNKPADANGDGLVDGIDYVVWLNHYQQGVTQSGGVAIGNFNYPTDNFVDGLDYVVWLNNYGA